MSDVERIAKTYSHTLRSDLVAELNRLRAKEREFRAALDEANTERDEAVATAVRWEDRASLLEKSCESAHRRSRRGVDLILRWVDLAQKAEAERDRLAEQLALRDQACVLGGQEVQRQKRRADRAVAQVQRVEALCDVYGPRSFVPVRVIRAALAGEGPEHGA